MIWSTKSIWTSVPFKVKAFFGATMSRIPIPFMEPHTVSTKKHLHGSVDVLWLYNQIQSIKRKTYSSWWFFTNPIWKICVKLGSWNPKVPGVNIKKLFSVATTQKTCYSCYPNLTKKNRINPKKTSCNVKKNLPSFTFFFFPGGTKHDGYL